LQSELYILAAFHLTLATLMELFYPCYLTNVKQGQMMLVSVASIKWNAAISRVQTGQSSLPARRAI